MFTDLGSCCASAKPMVSKSCADCCRQHSSPPITHFILRHRNAVSTPISAVSSQLRDPRLETILHYGLRARSFFCVSSIFADQAPFSL